MLSSGSWAQQPHGPSPTEALEVAMSDLQTQMEAVLIKLDDLKSGNMAICLGCNLPSAPMAVDRTEGLVPLAPSVRDPVLQGVSFMVDRCPKTDGELRGVRDIT